MGPLCAPKEWVGVLRPVGHSVSSTFPCRRIRAGTELTWDYNYEVGSVEGKELLCCCGAIECRGRLP